MKRSVAFAMPAHIPDLFEQPFGTFSLHHLIDAEASFLSEHFDVSVFATQGWKDELADKPYKVEPVFTVQDGRLAIDGGPMVPRGYLKALAKLGNASLIYTYDPFTLHEVAVRSFPWMYKRRFWYPKLALRYTTNLEEWSDSWWRSVATTVMKKCPVLFNGPHGPDEAAKYMAAEGVYRPKRDLWFDVSLGIDTDLLDRHRARRERTSPFKVRAPWTRWSQQKDPETFVKVLSQVGALRKVDASIPMFDSGSDYLARLESAIGQFGGSGVVRLEPDPHPPGDREAYAESLKDQHAFLSTSRFESFGLTQLEYLYSGMVGLYLDTGAYAKSVLPNYPFVFSKAELPSALVALIDDYEQAQRDIEPFRALIKERYSLDAWRQRLLDTTEKLFAGFVVR